MMPSSSATTQWTGSRRGSSGLWFIFKLAVFIAGSALVTYVCVIRSIHWTMDLFEIAVAVPLCLSTLGFAMTYAHGDPSLTLDKTTRTLELRHTIVHRYFVPRRIRHLSVPYRDILWIEVSKAKLGPGRLISIGLPQGSVTILAFESQGVAFADSLMDEIGLERPKRWKFEYTVVAICVVVGIAAGYIASNP